MRFSSLVLPAAATVLLAVPAQAQPESDEWMQRVHAQLQEATTTVASEGYQPLGQTFTGDLNAGASQEHLLQLPAGAALLIVGVCDQDCTDLDLWLYSPTGQLLDSDIAVDAVPVVQLDSPTPGMYKVKVDMSTCSSAPCRYGIAIFTR